MTDLQIKCFLEVAQRLSFTKAAKSLFISQSNISRQIASLEEELGLVLFDRNTKGVKPTLQGQMLAESLSQMLSEWEFVLARARNSLKKYNGRVCVGCQEHIKANSYLSQVLSGFREVHPEIQIIKERSTQKKLLEGLRDDYFDAILIADHDVKYHENVTKLTLFYSRVGIVIHKRHPLFHKKDVSLSDFKDSVFLRYDPTNIKPEDDFMYNICRYYGFEPKIAATFDYFEEFLFSIEMGDGVSLVFEETEVISNMNLRFIPIDDDVPQKFLPMQLTRKNGNKNEALLELNKYAAEYARLNSNVDEIGK